MTEKDIQLAALKKLSDIKGKEYVLQNKDNLYLCWNISNGIAQISILLSDGNDGSIFDAKGTLTIDESNKAKEEFKFEVELKNGNCTYIQ